MWQIGISISRVTAEGLQENISLKVKMIEARECQSFDSRAWMKGKVVKRKIIILRRIKKEKQKIRRRRRAKLHFNQSTVWTTEENYADFGMRWKRLFVLCSRLGHQARGPTLALRRSLLQRCHFSNVYHPVLRKFIGRSIDFFFFYRIISRRFFLLWKDNILFRYNIAILYESWMA